MDSDEILKLKNDVVKAAKQVYEKGLVESGEGNVSSRIPEKNELLITPTFNKYYNLKESDIVHIKFNGTLIGEGEPSTEYKLHVAVYKSRPRANFVIHTHSPYATMLSVAKKRIPILLEEQVIFLGGSVEISEFALAHSENLALRVLDALGTKNGVLMANHGTLAIGRSVDHAIKISELIEKLAMIYYGAKQLGNINDIAEKSCGKFLKDFEEKFSTTLN